jgi:hypothetical protein
MFYHASLYFSVLTSFIRSSLLRPRECWPNINIQTHTSLQPDQVVRSSRDTSPHRWKNHCHTTIDWYSYLFMILVWAYLFLFILLFITTLQQASTSLVSSSKKCFITFKCDNSIAFKQLHDLLMKMVNDIN